MTEILRVEIPCFICVTCGASFFKKEEAKACARQIFAPKIKVGEEVTFRGIECRVLKARPQKATHLPEYEVLASLPGGKKIPLGWKDERDLVKKY